MRRLSVEERQICTEGSKVDEEPSGLLMGSFKLHVKRRTLR
jgi:hypothetical protein